MTDLTDKKVQGNQLRITNLSIIAFILSFSPAYFIIARVAIATISIELLDRLNAFFMFAMFAMVFVSIVLSIIDLFGKNRKKLLSIIALVVNCIFIALIASAFSIIISSVQPR